MILYKWLDEYMQYMYFSEYLLKWLSLTFDIILWYHFLNKWLDLGMASSLGFIFHSRFFEYMTFKIQDASSRNAFSVLHWRMSSGCPINLY